MVEKEFKVRFAPSPTGYLHIGSARTALFNWIFAKKYNAKFILRIEDTDQNRSKKEFLEEIVDSLKWLGINWDEIAYQSQRLQIYNQYAQTLVDNGLAYKEGNAVIFPYKFDQLVFEDLIRGTIIFKELPKDREVLIKSDGMPTYNFACVIDDALFGITHVIRGEDHISNTPKQILLAQALNLPLPRFAHLPMILSEQGGKMSKRYGATAIRDYREQGFLSEAIVNYLLLLGWSPGKDRELVSFNEAVQLFQIEQVNKTAAAFSIDKLKWINSQYIRNMSNEELTNRLREFLKDKLPNFDSEEDKAYFSRIAGLFKERIETLEQFWQWADFCFMDKVNYSPDTEKILSRNLSEEIEKLIEILTPLEPFLHSHIEVAFRQLAEDLGLKVRDLVHPVRVALTGRKVGPGLFETMEALGKDKVILRLKQLVEYWRKEG